MVHVVSLTINDSSKKTIMQTSSKKPALWAGKMGLLGIGMCALCCALPVLGIVGGTGAMAFLSLYAEKIALALLVISASLFAFWQYKRIQAPTCSVDCSCKTESATSTDHDHPQRTTSLEHTP